MAQTCPISFNRIDAHLVRIVAAEVITVALLLLITQNLVFALLLLFDFSVRVLKLKNLSLFAFVARIIIEQFEIKAQPCDEAPKRFALYLGVGIVALFTIFYALHFTLVASTLVGVLLLCAFFEAAFDYCVGCKIYHLLQLISKRVS